MNPKSPCDERILAGGFRVCGCDQGFPIALDLRLHLFRWEMQALAGGFRVLRNAAGIFAHEKSNFPLEHLP